jgi:hypothetical protein
MTAAEALKTAWAAGIQLGIDNDHLLLEAAVPPPSAVIDLLLRHKSEVLASLAAIEYERNEHRLAASKAPFQAVTLLPKQEPASEKPSSARRGRIENCGSTFLHFCVECGRFGPYGYDVRLRAGRLGRWYCHDHRPQEHDEVRA